MLKVNTKTRQITIHRGDTGKITFRIRGYGMEDTDRALFTLRAPGGQIVREEQYRMEENQFTVRFRNADTDQLTPGSYSWDVRIIHVPVYDDNGRIYDTAGGFIRTPMNPAAAVILPVVGDV